MLTLRTLLSVVAAGLVAAGLGTQAQAFPDKSVNYIIPFGPGGESDVTARMQQSYFKKLFDEDLVVSYKPGGGGAVGWSQLNNMTSDGHTIMGVNLPHIVVKPRQKAVGFKTEDLAIVYMFHYTPDAIVVNADSPFKTLADIVEFAKKNPKKLTLSGSGKGTANHLAQVQFDDMAGIKTTYVPFKGTGAAVTALLGDQVRAEWGYTTVGAKQGDRVRMLAVAMEERHPAFPDVPTFRELGYELVGGAYRGIAVPKSTPEEIRKRLSDMIGEINADADFQKQMIDAGFALVDVPHDEMDAFMAEKTDLYVGLAKSSGMIK